MNTEHPTPVRVRSGYRQQSHLVTEHGTVTLIAGSEAVITDTGATRRPLVEIHIPETAVSSPGVVVLCLGDTDLLAKSLAQAVKAARHSVTAQPTEKEAVT